MIEYLLPRNGRFAQRAGIFARIGVFVKLYRSPDTTLKIPWKYIWLQKIKAKF